MADLLREGPIRKMLRERGIRGEAVAPTERSHHDTLVLASVSEALATAMKQITSTTDRRVAIQEFWHSLNRKGIVRNDEVYSLVDMSIRESGR